ncbi:glycosyltransferase family 4 protein [Haliea sp. E17]|uniref:glycosyltransferase family 4 protein n=1 Tax=Haliea sp. E17 TaxID=3401576 RepID=UPI003AAE82A4
MKILHVCWDLGQGGIQRYLIDLLAVQCRNHDCRLLVLSSPGPLSDQLSALPVQVSYMGMKSGSDFKFFAPILKFLRQGNHQIIHSHANNIIFNATLAFQRCPVAYTEHGGRFLKGEFASFLLYTFFAGNIDRFIAISDYMGRLMRQRSQRICDRIDVVHNGIPLTAVLDCELNGEIHDPGENLPDAPLVGFLGRLVPEKGVDIFVDMAELLHQTHPEVRFVVIGDGPMLEDLQAEVRNRGLEQVVIFLGYQPEARRILPRMKLLAMTSRLEAFGLVILEAFAASIPVVALGEHSASSEIIRDGIDGYVVENSGLELLAKRVASLLDDSEKAESMGRLGNERLNSEYSIEKNAEKLEKIYTELLEPRLS